MQTSTTKDSAVNKASKANTTIHKKSEDLANDFRSFVTETEALLKATAEYGGTELTLARAKLNERLVHAKHSLAEMGEALSDRASATAESANNYVHEKPWQAVGIGAAVGFVAGLILNRR